MLAINDGQTMTVVRRLLGHSSTDITEKVYARLPTQTVPAETSCHWRSKYTDWKLLFICGL